LQSNIHFYSEAQFSQRYGERWQF